MHELECSRIGARYFGLSELRELSGELDPDTFFDGVEESAFVLLDDLDCWLPDPMHERMLFNLYNQFRISGQKLVVSSAQAPRQIRLTLPDLQSRLNSGLLLSLAPLDDAQKTCLLQYWSTERGFALTGDAAAYILSRSGRSVQELRSVIDQLDHASLTEKNRVTMPFIKKTFGW
jgi:DnaA family protein